jgi:hypothetical protein
MNQEETGLSEGTQVSAGTGEDVSDRMPAAQASPPSLEYPDSLPRDGRLFQRALFGLLFMVFVFFLWHVYVSRNSITVHDQALSDVVIIDEVVISNPRGGKIKLSINGVSPGGTMVGFSAWLPRGTHSYVGIPLGVPNTENSRGKEIIRPREGDTLFASLHDVNIFELGITPEHRVLRDILGRLVVKKLIVR